MSTDDLREHGIVAPDQGSIEGKRMARRDEVLRKEQGRYPEQLEYSAKGVYEGCGMAGQCVELVAVLEMTKMVMSYG